VIDSAEGRDLGTLVVPGVGVLRETGDPFEPYQLVDPGGAVVTPVAAYLTQIRT
jgi:hypothetical protein